jgi:methionyl-tRNA formyltransferase
MKSDTRFQLVLFVAQDFGYQFVQHLKTLHELDMLVVSFDDAYDLYYGYRSTLDLCKESGVPCIDYLKNKDRIYDIVTSFRPTHIICGYFDKLLSQKIISAAKHGAFNIHPGYLPQYMGPFPTAWAILNGESSFGITIHYVDVGIDTGDILFQKMYDILPDETGFELYIRSMQLSATFYIEKLSDILNLNFKPIKQIGCGSYYGNIPIHVQIDWQKPTSYICNEVRVHTLPYFPAYSFIKNKCVLFKKCSVVDKKEHTLQGAGRILEVFENGAFLVSGVDSIILVEDYEFLPLDDHGLKFNHIHKGLKFK